MKYMYILLALCSITGVTAQKTIDPIDYRNVVLKEEGDSLVMAFDMVIPALSVKSRQSLVVIPAVKDTDGNSHTYGYVQLNGKNRSKSLKRTAALKKQAHITEYPLIEETICGCLGQVIHYSQVVPYESWMDKGYLMRTERLLGCAKSSMDSEHDFGIWVETAPRPPAIPPVNYIAPKPIVKERDVSGKAYLDFHKAKHTIDPSYRNNPQELLRIMEIVNKTNLDKDIVLHGLYITGYASPEGNATYNQQLANRRANSLSEYVQRMSGIPVEKFTVQAIGEDWKGLREMVEAGDMIQRDKVLAIIDNDADLDRKEQQLKALGAPYHYLLSEVFPALRRVEYSISYTVKDYSLTEAQQLLNSDPSKLNSYELYLLAQLYEEGSEKWNEIIELTVSLYPDEPEANINAAAVYINQGEYEKARASLEKVKHLPEAANNLYIYEEMERQGLLN